MSKIKGSPSRCSPGPAGSMAMGGPAMRTVVSPIGALAAFVAFVAAPVQAMAVRPTAARPHAVPRQVVPRQAVLRQDEQPAFSAIPPVLPGDVSSVGFEALGMSEFGDQVGLAPAGQRALRAMRVV